MKIDTLTTLLIEQLRDLYDAERQLVKALPKMAKAASADELREAFTEHLEVTKGQVQRLEQAFEALRTNSKGKPCTAMKGLIEEGQETMQEDISEELMDIALIAAAQKVEHYEIAGYGTVRSLAEKLNHEDVAELLEETENEEKQADAKLTEVTQTLLKNVNLGQDEADDMEEKKPVAKPAAKRSGGR